MQEDSGQLNRRTFLKLSSAAAAGLVGSNAYSQISAAENAGPLTTRSAPENPIIVKSAELEVVLDRHDGLPYEYRLLRGNRRMIGEDLGKPIVVTFYDKSSGTIKNANASVQKYSELKEHSDLLFQIQDGSQSAVGFVIAY